MIHSPRFDFNWWHATSDAATIGQKIATYGAKPAQLKVDGKIFASSFSGDQLDVAAMRSAAGTPVFWAPNIHPEQGTNFGDVDGALNWMVSVSCLTKHGVYLINESQAWPNNGNNKAPTPGANVTVAQGDDAYVKALAGKPYIARKF